MRSKLYANSVAVIAAAAILIPIFMGIEAVQAATHGPRDSEITLAVERSLSKDDTIPHDRIDVLTAQGIVTLTGNVPSLYANERAVQQAQSIKGVRAVIDKLEVRAADRTDGEVAQDVSKALVADPATNAFELNATAAKGIITLTGTVRSWAESQLAESVAKDVKGVQGIRNNLQVDPKMDRSDDEIQADIEQRFKNDVWLSGNQLKVEVKDGAVVLTGTAGSALEKSRAATYAYVLGVKSVEDQGVKVEPRKHLRRTQYASKSDEEIKRAVKDAFLYDPRVWSFSPTVTVKYGAVALSGVVDNLKAKRAAEEDANNTVGVRVVKNYLKVRTDQQPSDETVTKNVRSALFMDPLVDRYQLTTTVHDGTVLLYGSVDSYAEKWRAEDVASRVKGVLAVKNHLTVHDSWTWARDWEIKADIEDELWWSPFVDEDQVRVSVNDGTATLTGIVDSRLEKRMATENAFEGGAKSVRNYLAVDVD